MLRIVQTGVIDIVRVDAAELLHALVHLLDEGVHRAGDGLGEDAAGLVRGDDEHAIEKLLHRKLLALLDAGGRAVGILPGEGGGGDRDRLVKAQIAALDRLEHEQRRCDLRDARGIELLVLVLGIEHAPARPVDEQGGLGLNIQRLVRVGQRRQTQDAHQHGKQKNRYNAANFHSSFSPSMV